VLQLHVSDERTVFEVCMTWFDHCPELRRRDLPSVMKCVRFANIDSYYLNDRVSSNPTLHTAASDDTELAELFDKVRAYHMMPNRRTEV